MSTLAHRIELCIDCHNPQRLSKFWKHALGWREQPNSWGDPELVNAEGNLTIWFQPVPEAKSGKNRLHLDVYSHDLETTVASLELLGAEKVGPLVAEDVNFQVMLDPEGNEFCVCRERREEPS